MSEYLRVLMEIKSLPKTFSSDFARRNAGLVAEAASRHHITCLTADGRNGGAWEISALGVVFLKSHGAII